MSDISLTASMRSNLLSLQNTQSLMDTTQERLSTGKKSQLRSGQPVFLLHRAVFNQPSQRLELSA